MNTQITESRPAITAGTYTIDPTRSTVRFAIKELWGLMTVRGTLDIGHGTIVVAEQPARSSVQVTMDPASLATGNKRRDKDVTGKNFLDAAAYPAMGFTSTGVGRHADGWRVTGVLAVHGVTAAVTLPLVEGRQTPDGCTFNATTELDRTMFGVDRAVGFIGRRLDVAIEIVAAASA